jgi:hypothetical protein
MITTSGMRCTLTRTDEGTTCQVVLPDGRKVELCSKEGANDFVDTVGTDFISTNLTTEDEEKLVIAYMIMIETTDNASTEKIAAGIPESELRTFVEHSRDILDKLSTDRTWLSSGTLERCHQKLLTALACFSNHLSFVKIFLSDGGMKSAAKFYATRVKNDRPCPGVARCIVMLVDNSIRVLLREDFHSIDPARRATSCKKVFGTMEKTGLLGQLIRCIPVDPKFPDLEIMQLLQTCLKLVKKKLKTGTRTGDILDAVIAGKDGPINAKAKSCLVKLQTMARLSNDGYDSECRVAGKCCRLCDTAEAQMNGVKLMECRRCKVTYYCNKECQAADWQDHKESCKAFSAGGTGKISSQKVSYSTMWTFVESNYFAIAREVYKKTQEYNVPKKELLLEIDFCGDAPALRNEFKVGLTSRFWDGSSLVDEPDWFRTRDEDAEKNNVIRWLKDNHECTTSDNLQAVCRSGDGQVSANRLGLSDEAVESIGREDYDRMVASLGQGMTDNYFREKRSRGK